MGRIDLHDADREMAEKVRETMGIEDFMRLYNRAGFRDALHALVNGYSRNAELREDMLQEAWIAISQKPPDLTDELYLSVGAHAAKACSDRERRYEGRFHENWEIKKERDRDRQRMRRARKKARKIIDECHK